MSHQAIEALRHMRIRDEVERELLERERDLKDRGLDAEAVDRLAAYLREHFPADCAALRLLERFRSALPLPGDPPAP